MLYFLIPVFNEEKNLEKLHDNLLSVATEYEKFYVFSDDGSKDSSLSLIEKLFKSEKHIVLGDGANHGPGVAFNTGFEWILDHSKNPGDKVVTVEADNTSDVSILPTMLKLSEMNYQLVLASVYAQGGGFDETSFLRRFVSSVAAIIMRNFFNIKVLTISSFYRIYSIELLRNIKVKNKAVIKEPGFISVVEILIKAIKLNASIIEVPMVLYSKQRKGKSKMKVLKTSFEYLKFLIRNKIKP
jgi:dolichol-phosphate mannosyltransferase